MKHLKQHFKTNQKETSSNATINKQNTKRIGATIKQHVKHNKQQQSQQSMRATKQSTIKAQQQTSTISCEPTKHTAINQCIINVVCININLKNYLYLVMLSIPPVNQVNSGHLALFY